MSGLQPRETPHPVSRRGAHAEFLYALGFASQHLTAPRGGRLPLANAAPGPADAA